MEETTITSPETGTVTPRPTPPKPRLASPRVKLPSGRGISPGSVHVYAPWALVAAVVILALAVLGVISVPGQKSEAWQAVFLTNGQTYFGHIARATPNWLTLRDVYYLQTQVVESEVGRSIAPNVTLIKLGKELHGPEDEMRINRQHVLYTEALRDDSEVVQAIARAANAADAPATPSESPSDAATQATPSEPKPASP